MKPKLLDLFCKAGGAGKGWSDAGFEVIGVDIEPQPHYPFEFHQADALTFPLEGFDFIHASPPCQAFSILTPTAYKKNHPDLIKPIRERLKSTGKPYCIENVKGARKELINPFMLCGTMFGLPIYRHRYFETNFEVGLVQPCSHFEGPVLVSGTTKRKVDGVRQGEFGAEVCRQAMKTPWMTRTDMDEAIPPAFTEWIGKQFLSLHRLQAA